MRTSQDNGAEKSQNLLQMSGTVGLFGVTPDGNDRIDPGCHKPQFRLVTAQEALDNTECMASLQTTFIARQTIRKSPWILCGAVLGVVGSCSYGLAPHSYLLGCVGVAIIWSAMLVLSWRRRSEWLGLSSLIFFIFGQQIFWHRFGGGQTFEILQGGFLTLAINAALLFSLRRWLYKIAKLENDLA